MIKPNEGKTDRIIRLVVGTLLFVYSYTYLQDSMRTLGLVFGSLLFITGAIGWCGLYTLVGINTCPVKIKSKKK